VLPPHEARTTKRTLKKRMHDPALSGASSFSTARFSRRQRATNGWRRCCAEGKVGDETSLNDKNAGGRRLVDLD
jgi:hypothetical protein